MRLTIKNPSERWWYGVYADSIHIYLRKKEQSFETYRKRSPQLCYRRCLVDYIAAVCENKFCRNVQHLAIHYLDIFMDSHNIQPEFLQLIAVCCLIIAVKVDEKDFKIPKMSYFSDLLGKTFKLRMLVTVEKSIMDFLEWKLLVPTAVSFAEYYALFVIQSSDTYGERPIECVVKAEKYAEQYINYFLDMSLQDVGFKRYTPSIIAASCILTTRLCLFIYPTWPQQLSDVTCYMVEDLESCVQMMIRILDEDDTVFKQHFARVDVKDDDDDDNDDDSVIYISDSNSESQESSTTDVDLDCSVSSTT